MFKSILDFVALIIDVSEMFTSTADVPGRCHLKSAHRGEVVVPRTFTKRQSDSLEQFAVRTEGQGNYIVDVQTET